MKIQSVLIAVVILLVVGYFGYKAYNQFTSEKPERELVYFGPIKKGDNGENIYHTVSDFKFTDQDSNEVTPASFEGKVYVTDFFFTTCGSICPKMTTNLVEVQKAFVNNPKVMLLSHTVFPETDSVSVLKKYAQKNGVIDSKWNLVTGDKKQIYTMARKSYLAVKLGKPEELYDMVHTENFVLVDAKRRVRGFYDGTKKEEIERLIEDINFLCTQ